MGSAGLAYDAEGRVAWDRIWQRFCDLAMAGGPPHKGALLRPGAPEDIGAQPDRYLDVIEELGRGITLASELPAGDSPDLGWIRVQCHSEVMAGWMLRAITMENVAVRLAGRALDLPASPAFRLDKEIKNVVTVVAKTTHYWMGHMPREQKIAIGALFESLARECPLIEPDWADASGGWRGLTCASVPDALWLSRALIASNVLARREGTTVFVPVNPATDPGGTRVDALLARFRIHTRHEGTDK
jgi:sirohydrochlorin cobaltochelatase